MTLRRKPLTATKATLYSQSINRQSTDIEDQISEDQSI